MCNNSAKFTAKRVFWFAGQTLRCTWYRKCLEWNRRAWRFADHSCSQAQSNDHDTERIYLWRRRKMVALFQTFYYVIHNGHKRTPMHIMNAQAIHETYKSSTLIQSFDHLGQCIGYDKVWRYHTDMATLTAEKTVMMYQSQVTLILKPSQPFSFLITKKQPYQELVAAMTQCQVLF